MLMRDTVNTCDETYSEPKYPRLGHTSLLETAPINSSRDTSERQITHQVLSAPQNTGADPRTSPVTFFRHAASGKYCPHGI